MTSTTRSILSIQRLPASQTEVYEHDPDEVEVLENSEKLVPYSQTSQEDTEDNTTDANPPRFKPPSRDIDIEKLSSKSFAPATEKKILWATKLYMEWRESHLSVDQEKGDIFKANLNAVDIDPEALCQALYCFLNEVRRVDGEEYPGNTLYTLVIMLQLFFEKQGKDWKLLEGKIFHPVRNTLDNLMKVRALSRISKAANSSDPITQDEEDRLWDEGILGKDEPDVLHDIIMYLVGLTFALRGSREQCALRCPGFEPQILVKRNDDGVEYLEYHEDLHTKTNQGGLTSRKVTPKVVRAYGHTNIERNIVRLYKKYVSLLPQDPKSPALYKYSLARGRRSGHMWFTDKPLGINTVMKTVKSMMNKIGAEGHFTNHSLRVSAATRMFSSGIEEQIVKEHTGHRSDAVRAYKRTSEHLLEVAEHVTIGDKCKPSCTMSKPESDDEGVAPTMHVN